MTYRTIMIPVTCEEDVSSGLDTALMFAKQTKGHVMALHIRENFNLDPSIRFHPMSREAVEVTREEHVKICDERAQQLRSEFEETCQKNGVDIALLEKVRYEDEPSASWNDREAPLPTGFGLAARMADLIVLPYPAEEELGQRFGLFETLLLDSGRPLLLSPDGGSPKFPKRIIVAWDGSLEASRALASSLPLLKDASEVTVLTIEKVETGAPDTNEATDFLQRHDVRANADMISKSDEPTAQQILDYAKAREADLVVMGAYSHSRVWEVIFGGVTNHMLKHADIALLLSH